MRFSIAAPRAKSGFQLSAINHHASHHHHHFSTSALCHKSGAVSAQSTTLDLRGKLAPSSQPVTYPVRHAPNSDFLLRQPYVARLISSHPITFLTSTENHCALCTRLFPSPQFLAWQSSFSCMTYTGHDLSPHTSRISRNTTPRPRDIHLRYTRCCWM